VIRGQKTFTMHPPTDQPFIPYGKIRVYGKVCNLWCLFLCLIHVAQFQAAVYRGNGDRFDVVDDNETGKVILLLLFSCFN
jgi:hypothetical protein